MTGASGALPMAPYSHRIAWIVFVGLLLLAALLIVQSSNGLPARMAVHFDAAGNPNSFMPANRYLRLTLLFALGLPIALVGIMTAVFSRAIDFKLPNRDYWLAPERLARTRSVLVRHGIWAGSLLTGFMCFMHWLVLAHSLYPRAAIRSNGFDDIQSTLGDLGRNIIAAAKPITAVAIQPSTVSVRLAV